MHETYNLGLVFCASYRSIDIGPAFVCRSFLLCGLLSFGVLKFLTLFKLLHGSMLSSFLQE